VPSIFTSVKFHYLLTEWYQSIRPCHVVSIEETARDNVSNVDTDKKIEELFPEVDLETGIFKFEDD